MFEDIPDWGWMVILLQVIIIYNMTRIEKGIQSRYTFIMKELRLGAFREEED